MPRKSAPLLIALILANNYAFSWNLNANIQGQAAKVSQALKTIAAPLVISTGLLSGTFVANAAELNRDVYFGVGCFWHVQHEFVMAEQTILGRGTDEVTAAAGYAGSKKLGKNANDPLSQGVVCYHNLQRIGDYGKLGYGEVVGLQIPKTEESMAAFAKEYFSLFVNGDRPDLGDKGPEYRALMGLPGGINNPLFSVIENEAKEKGISVVEGKGNDADTSGKKKVWVMDSSEFPFKQAEVYHQFHDGFMPGEQYPESYNSLVKGAFRDGRIVPTGCPDIV